ncbi:MAG TPA: methionyl-tRNA formyltransferase [Tenericutes bacterium]|nr:methionyl-tRNA formyltransferase [Mycoplasmatota bacterium]
MGTPEFSVPVLEGLIEKYKVRAVVTQPDKKVGRDGIISFSPIKKVAQKHTILVLQPEKIKNEYQEIIDLRADLIITCAYGQIIPKELLDAPRLGCINVHASLLPKLRGGAPIHKAIIDGYSKTGITIMYMNEKMDAGDIISQKEIKIEENDTASTLHDKLKILGRDLLLETLPSIIDGTSTRTKQNENEVTYAFTIKREDEKLDFNKTTRQIYNQVRGLNSWPGAYCLYEGKILKIWGCYQSYEIYPTAFIGEITKIYKDGFGVKTSNGEIVITEVQLEGKKRMSAIEFINGLPNKEKLIGKILS